MEKAVNNNTELVHKTGGYIWWTYNGRQENGELMNRPRKMDLCNITGGQTWWNRISRQIIQSWWKDLVNIPGVHTSVDRPS